MDEQESPHLKAMHEAMKQAEEAAERRRLAKLKAQEEAPAPFDLDADLAEDLRVIHETVIHHAAPEDPAPLAIDAPEDLEDVLRQLDAELPDLPDREVHGDLVVFRHDERAQAWYELAGEEALPAALRGVKGPLDVKRLLQAMIVEVGDVKRTNAILMDMMTRIEEKVERTNRLLRDRRFHP